MPHRWWMPLSITAGGFAGLGSGVPFAVSVDALIAAALTTGGTWRHAGLDRSNRLPVEPSARPPVSDGHEDT